MAFQAGSFERQHPQQHSQHQQQQQQHSQPQQRPYDGMAAHRPLQRPQYPQPGSITNPASFAHSTQGHQREFDDYGGYYDDGAACFPQEYQKQLYPHPAYQRGLPPGPPYPPQGYSGGGNYRPPGRGRPMPRGGISRAATADAAGGGWNAPRGGPMGRPYGYAPGVRGRLMPYERSAKSDAGFKPRRGLGEIDASFDGGPFPSFPGQPRKSDMEEEQRLVNQMAGMAVHPPIQPHPQVTGPARGTMTMGTDFDRRGPHPQRFIEEAGPGSAYGAPPHPSDPRNGFRVPEYKPPSTRDNYGPPDRSMTMSAAEPMRHNFALPSQHSNSFPFPQASLGNGPPPRPTSALGQYNQPRRQHTTDQLQSGGPYWGAELTGTEEAWPEEQQSQTSRASFDDVFRSHQCSDSRSFNPEYVGAATDQRQAEWTAGDHRSPPPSLDGPPQLRGVIQGSGRASELPRMKSSPNLRQRETGVADEAGLRPVPHNPSLPPLPPMPPMPLAASMYQAYRPPQSQLRSVDGGHNDDLTAIGNSTSTYGQYPMQQPSLPHPNGASTNTGQVHATALPRVGTTGYDSRLLGDPHNVAPSRPVGGLSSQPSQHAPHTSEMAHAVSSRQGSANVISANDRPMPVRNYNGLPSSDGASVTRSISASSNSMASPGSQLKPPPIRNYNGIIPAAGADPVALDANGATTLMSAGTPKPPPVTLEELELLRLRTKGDPSDRDTALLLAKKLLEATDVLVPEGSEGKMQNKVRERFIQDAQRTLKKLCGAQVPEAMFLMADSLGRGLFGSEPDNKEAFALYQSAAKLGHPAAAYRTAVCCEIGSEEGGGTRKDPLKAMQWYRRAATLGDTPAMYKLGMILLKGLLGQGREPREGISWLKRAAERADAENPHALHELGLLYESAGPKDVILHDDAYALKLFSQAAELGYKFSQFRLGCAHEYGLLGCTVDPRPSIAWYSRAAAQEEHQAELALSGWYLTGSDGVLAQSDTEAYLWARKAAMAGLAKAEYAMGYFTEVGIGVPSNLEDAKRWYWRAAAQEFPKARERLEDLKRTGKAGPRQRERISRSKVGKQQEGECAVM